MKSLSELRTNRKAGAVDHRLTEPLSDCGTDGTGTRWVADRLWQRSGASLCVEHSACHTLSAKPFVTIIVIICYQHQAFKINNSFQHVRNTSHVVGV